jgi:hypothetical protein
MPPARRAQPPQASAITAAGAEREAIDTTRINAAHSIERRRQVRGLLLLALVILTLSITRAGMGNVFPHGWWRLWSTH